MFHPGVAIRRGDFKCVAIDNGDRHLFDLATDPLEERDLAAGKPEIVQAFEPFLRAWESRRARAPVYRAGEVADEEIADHLRILGYIE